jgi:putative hydrolase of the HAD superfamily
MDQPRRGRHGAAADRRNRSRGALLGDSTDTRGEARRVWLFDLDDTLHDAGSAVFGALHESMSAYVEQALAVDRAEADRLRRHYWLRYGATLLGLIRHHGVPAAHFLHETHRLPGLEGRLKAHRHDIAALARLRGPKLILTNAPRAYALRVLEALGLRRLFVAVITIEDMAQFGHLRPKPDARMLRALAARLRVAPSHCVLVEDTLVHQKAARRVGMKTVWMRRWARPGAARRLRGRPAYVDRSVRSLQALRRRPV